MANCYDCIRNDCPHRLTTGECLGYKPAERTIADIYTKPNKWKALDVNGNVVIGYPNCVYYIKHTQHEEPPIYRNELAEEWYMSVCDLKDLNNISWTGFGATMFKTQNILIIPESLIELKENEND